MAIFPDIPLEEKIAVDVKYSIENKHRDNLGYSSSGDVCKRKIWYDLHWSATKYITDRTERIFETGNQAENFMINSLTKAGYKITDQQLEVSGCHRHVFGHIDGLIHIPEYEPMLLELKTMKDSNFKAVIKNKVKKAQWKYYCQMQAYMGKLGLKKGLYMAYNKDNSDYYFEIIDYNQNVFEDIESMWDEVITSEYPPDKIGNSTWFECKYCHNSGICHKMEAIDKNCRTCEFGDIHPDGLWKCASDNDVVLSINKQRTGCKKWQLKTVMKK